MEIFIITISVISGLFWGSSIIYLVIHYVKFDDANKFTFSKIIICLIGFIVGCILGGFGTYLLFI